LGQQVGLPAQVGEVVDGHRSHGSVKGMDTTDAGAPASPFSGLSDPIITITPAAHAELVALRAIEPDAERLGLRLELTDDPPPEFTYDLSFEVVTQAALSDEVRNHD